MGQAKYKLVSEHAEDLASGELVEPGEFVHLTDEETDEPRNRQLMADGKLIGTGEKSQEEVAEAEKEIQRQQKKEKGGSS